MVAVRLEAVIRRYLTIVTGSSIHANAEKRRSEEKELGVLKRITGGR